MEQRAARIRALVSEAEHGAKKHAAATAAATAAAAAAAAAAKNSSSRGASPPPALRSHVGLCVESSSRAAAHRAEAQQFDGLDTSSAVHTSSHSSGKHVSAFRRTVLEERRAQKEAAAAARHELEGQLARAASYAEKVRLAARASAERARAHKLRGPVDDPWAYKTAAHSGSAVPRPPPLSSASARSAQRSPQQQQQRAVLQRKYAEEGDAPLGGSSSGSVVLPHVGFGHRAVGPRLAGPELAERQAAVRAAAVEAQRHRAARRRHREHELEIAERAAAVAAADDAGNVSRGSFSAASVSKAPRISREAVTYEERLAMIEARVNGSSAAVKQA
jgi:trimeric autotransporter adhesin